jgi:acyl-CoA reductase-like NAD-dependent aldehyde dehydrogenase
MAAGEPPVTALVDSMVATAVAAQRSFAAWDEGRVDALLGDIAETIAEHAEELAIAAVAETRLGNVVDKTLKNEVASRRIYAELAGKPGMGLLGVDELHHVAELASPVGVIFGLIPRTHPVATFVFKTLIALKGRNALILSSHRDAQHVSNSAGELIVSTLTRHAAPAGLVQWLCQRTDRETTLAFMQHPEVALVLATGGAGMVRAAYSSGTPAIGVGPGNTPTWICADADLEAAAASIVDSKTYDNGIVCASEHNLVVDAAVRDAFATELERAGAVVLRPAEIDQFVAAIFDQRDAHVRRDLHGVSAARLLAAAGLSVPGPARLIVIPTERAEAHGALGREKLAPVTSLFTVSSDDEAIAVCLTLLANEGAGHTAIIHTRDESRIARFSHSMPVSRVLVNAPGTQGSLGLVTGLAPSLMLGTGTFGGTSTTDSVTYRHLLNIKRVAYNLAA